MNGDSFLLHPSSLIPHPSSLSRDELVHLSPTVRRSPPIFPRISAAAVTVATSGEQDSGGGKKDRSPLRNETRTGPLSESCPRQEGVPMKRFLVTTTAAAVEHLGTKKN